METINLPFEQLHISKMNMRHKESPPDTSHIRPTIREKGILQPLLVREEDGGFGIVFGRSRYYSAKEERADGNTRFDTLPCVIMQEADDANALEASIIENFARKDPHPIGIYDKMVYLLKMGRTEDGIAVTFGKTLAQVRQYLALGKLSTAIRKLYGTGAIDDDTAAALTMASQGQQREWVKLYEAEDAPLGRYVKDWLLGSEQIATSTALFPLEKYKGHLVGDLFSVAGEGAETVTYFRDLDLFWDLQNSAIAEKAEALQAEGWAEVHVLEVGHSFHPFGHVRTAKEKGGHVYISVTRQGAVETFKGWLTRKEVEAAEKAAEKAAKRTSKGASDEGQKALAQPPMTQTLQNYLDLHHHAIVRADLLDHPLVAFRLLVAHAYASSGNWSVEPDPQRSRSDAVAASVTASPAQAKFAQERDAVAALMKAQKGLNTEDAFARLLALPDAEVLRVAVAVMADTLAAGDDVVDAVGAHLQTDARRFWQPDDTFFELVRDRGTVNALLAEIGGKPLAKANVTEKAKTQKGIIRDLLRGSNNRPKIEGWLPGWMAFPFRAVNAKGKKPPAAPAPHAIAAE